MKRYTSFLFIIFSLVSSFNIISGQPGSLFYSGESLTYRVSWSVFRLGTIQIEAWRDSTSSDTDLYKVSMFVKSNPDIPFIEISELNETLVSASDCMSRSFLAKHMNNEDGVEIKCVYMEEFDQAIFSVKDINTDRLTRFNILKHVKPYLDGPSLFYFARQNSQSGKILTIPTLIDGEMQETILDFTGEAEYIEIDALEFPVRARKYTGIAKWTGGTSAGLGGNFNGWVCDDNFAVTLRAEMEVFLGSVIIELEDFHRPDWIPNTLVNNDK